MASPALFGMTTYPPYLIVTSSAVIPAWTVEELAAPWVECFTDHTAEIWAQPQLTEDQRRQLAHHVLLLFLGR